MKKQLLSLVVLFFSFIVTVTAQNTPLPEYTSRREVLQDEALRQDFILQGEYLAKMDNGAMGLHLIADGDGKFRVVNYPGGLPGDGWKADMPRLLGTAEVNGEEITFNMTEGRGTYAGQAVVMPEKIEAKGKILIEYQDNTGQGGTHRLETGTPAASFNIGRLPTVRRQRAVLRTSTQPRRNTAFSTPVSSRRGSRLAVGSPPHLPQPQITTSSQAEETGQFRGVPVQIEVQASSGMPALLFEKQFRQSPTLGAQPSVGAVVLFDGTNLDKFEEGAKMNESQHGNTLWAEATAKPFEKRPYTMHVEFMLSYMPQARGQQRSNSGVYLDERYECQVLDSFGLEGKNNECGGFYQVAEPIVNMCFPPLVWQTYDFDFTPAQYEGDTKVANARVAVRHNGVLIHDNIEFQKETPGRKKEDAEPLGVYLQGHGNKVQYRNIWMKYMP